MGLNDVAEVVKKYDSIKRKLKAEVFGQDKVIDDVINSIVNSILFEEKANNRPRGIFLFAGTPGVGKTFLAQKCAEYLGYEYRILNMSSYNKREDSVQSLFGIDAAWNTGKDGTLLEFVDSQKGKPCVVVLDEIEKAHQEVILEFLQILESGKTDNVFVQTAKKLPLDVFKKRGYSQELLERDEYTDFSNVYFFFTTNAGRPLYENGKQPAPDLTKEVIIDAIREDKNPVTEEPYFPDAILSRFQTGTVVMFRHLDTNELLRIGQKELIKNMNLIKKKYGLEIGIKSKIATLLLLKEGGQVDARNFRKIAENFVRDQVTGLTASLKGEMQNIKKISIDVDPEERESLNQLMFGQQREQDVILVCEDADRLEMFRNLLKGIEGIQIKPTNKYEGGEETKKDDAMSMIKEEVFDTPLIIAIMPPVKPDESLTMASINSVLPSRRMKNFKEFIEKAKKFNEKTILYIIDLDHSSEETKRDMLAKGATEIIDFSNSDEPPKIVKNKVNAIKLNNMAFDFARKGKALKYDIVPVVHGDTVDIRLRFFEKVDNIKSADDDFLIGQERMPNVSFEKVIGGERIKMEAADFIAFLQDPKAFVKKGLKAPKGLLLYGPPGTGKTHMAKAIANEAGVPFIATNGGEIKMGREKLNGSELLKKYFGIARKYAPSILFIDEMETIALNRTGRDPEADTIVNTLLAEMDGFEGHDSNPVIVIGATNAGIDKASSVNGRFLDPAVVRRFTRKFYVNVPLKAERLEHLVKETEGTGLTQEELETAAQMSQGLSFGRMNNAIEIAKRQAARENRKLTKTDLENAIETENFGEAREASLESRTRTAYHEAGHACIGCILGGQHMPEHATIVSRGDFGGYVGTAHDEKNGSYTKEFMENRIRGFLAGRCGEILYYGEPDGLATGPSEDIRMAYNYIVDMVCHLGMDEQVGVTYYAVGYDSETGAYTALRQDIQNRVNDLFQKYYRETMQMLTEHKKMYEVIAKKLLEKESLNRADLEKIAEKYNG